MPEEFESQLDMKKEYFVVVRSSKNSNKLGSHVGEFKNGEEAKRWTEAAYDKMGPTDAPWLAIKLNRL